MKLDRLEQDWSESPALVQGQGEAFDPGRCYIRLRDVFIAEGASKWKLEQQLTVSYALIVHLAGSGVLELEEMQVAMKKDHVYLVPPETTFGWSGDGSGELSVMVLRMDILEERDGRFAAVNEERIHTAIALRRGIPVTPAGRLEKLCRAIHANFNSKDKMKVWRAQIDCAELLYAAAAVHSERAVDTQQALERSKAYMEERYVEEITINQLAAIAELSPKYYVDLFKKTYGVSALDHLTKVRMEKAKHLMNQKERLLKDIAHEVGYSDPFYFSRKFKQTYGVSPSQYMKQRSRRVAVYGRTSILGYLLTLKVIPHAAPLHPMWSNLYYTKYGSEIPYHLHITRQNYKNNHNLDLVAESKPDLIITHRDLEPWERERLAGIATIVELPDEKAGWKQGLLALGEALGERSEARSWIASFESKIEREKKRLSENGVRPCVLTLKRVRHHFYLYRNQGMQDVLYDGLGVRSACEDMSVDCNIPISLEELDSIEADVVLLLVCRDSETLAEWKKLQQSPAWMSLRMVRENKVRQIPSEPWREYSPVALDRIVDEAMRICTGNCP